LDKTILITGGAGFIGSHCADNLLQRGYRVRALDSLDPQVHGPARQRPDYLSREVELMVGDVRDPKIVRKALTGVSAVFHFAARVGVGQSMYNVADYTSVNDVGTAVLLEALIERAREQPFDRLVVASSMSIYGEGLYRTEGGGLVGDAARDVAQLRRGAWDPVDCDGRALLPVATPESKCPALNSVYALGKYDQERLCLMLGAAYRIPTVALRFFNVYGSRQALSNPYTGVLAIFAARLLNDNRPLVFEDGQQRRDFVHVRDVAEACRLALEAKGAAGGVFNIGSGRSYTIVEIGERVADVMGVSLEPEVTGEYRVGDVRHCFGDITAARQVLNYQPRIQLDQGLAELADWLDGQTAVDRVGEMRAELADRGLTI
jgi:dTDP-L-rhamnose 4-epimerase